jgi:hypothetical protein
MVQTNGMTSQTISTHEITGSKDFYCSDTLECWMIRLPCCPVNGLHHHDHAMDARVMS